MFSIYKIFTYITNFFLALYILLEIVGTVTGQSSLLTFEDVAIFLFIIITIIVSSMFFMKIKKLFPKRHNRFQIIEASEIKNSLNNNISWKHLPYANLIIGIAIIFFTLIVFTSDPPVSFSADSSRVTSIVFMLSYGLAQIHSPLLVRKRVKGGFFDQ